MRGVLKANDLRQSKERFLRWNHRTLDFFFLILKVQKKESRMIPVVWGKEMDLSLH